MKKHIFRKGAPEVIKAVMLPLAFAAVVIVMIMSGLRRTEESNNAEGLRILKESISRAVVINYALEGSYPESLEYIVDNYGINIDEEKYFVDYSVFASNIMPDVTVLSKTGE